jgi:hypothetical protein
MGEHCFCSTFLTVPPLCKEETLEDAKNKAKQKKRNRNAVVRPSHIHSQLRSKTEIVKLFLVHMFESDEV